MADQSPDRRVTTLTLQPLSMAAPDHKTANDNVPGHSAIRTYECEKSMTVQHLLTSHVVLTRTR